MERYRRGECEKGQADMEIWTEVKNAARRVKQGRGDRGDKGNSSEQRTALWTLILSVSTVVLTIFTGLVFAYAVKQGQDVKESIGLARQTMVGDQRPWIGGPEATYANGRATFVFANTGKTPATGIYVNAGFAVTGYEASTLDRVCDEAGRGTPSRAVFGTEAITPNGKYVLHDLGPGRPFSQPDVLAYLRGNQFVVGCVFYGVPFDGKRHRTGFSIPIETTGDGTVGFGETSTLFPD